MNDQQRNHTLFESKKSPRPLIYIAILLRIHYRSFGLLSAESSTLAAAALTATPGAAALTL